MSGDVNLAKELMERGLFYQTNAENLETALSRSNAFYFGFDPTAESLHVGNLAGLMLAYHLVKSGKKCYLLAGGATARIGDPSFKGGERELVSERVVDMRAKKIVRLVKSIHGFGRYRGSIKHVSNLDWFGKMKLLDFLRNVGKHFTVNSMIKKDFIADRLTDENSISFAEFSYALLQGYDFYHLFTEKGCNLQIGGSDQWGNMIAGVELIRRKVGGGAFVITYPLVEDSTGRKFGKSEGNAVWLNPDMTKIFDLYQFFKRLPDAGIESYYKLFSFRDIVDVRENIEAVRGSVGGIQKMLAHDVVEFLHGEKIANDMDRLSDVVYGGGDFGLGDEKLIAKYLGVKRLSGKTPIREALVETGLVSGKGEADRVIKSGGVRVNGERVNSSSDDLNSLLKGRFGYLEKGRNRAFVKI